MDKKQQIVIFSGIGVVLVLLGLLIYILFFKDTGSRSGKDADTQQVQTMLPTDEFANDTLRLENIDLKLESTDMQFEGISESVEEGKLPVDVKELMAKYNETRNNVETLRAELRSERAKFAKEGKRSQAEIEGYRKKIAQLEAETEQLKGYCKDLLERLKELNIKYEEQVQINRQLTDEKAALQETVSSTRSENAALQQTVSTAKRLIITGVSLRAYNKKDKNEKKIQKAAKLGVSFTVTANNTAAPGLKTFYVTIKTPEGQQLTGGGSFSAEGTTLQATASRQIEYANEEVSTTVYWNVNTTLTPGSYTVRIFCDGTCLKTQHFNL